MTPGFDLNCDLGEGEPWERTLALLEQVDSANLAAGGHAGDAASFEACLRAAHRLGVHPGVHPGLPDRAGFGRGAPGPLTPADLAGVLATQVGPALDRAHRLGLPLHHLKLHGSLYHAVEADPALARTLAETAGRHWPGLILYARAGGALQPAADHAGVPVWTEGFLDRGYLDDGTLVPRGQPGALLSDPAEVVRRCRDLALRGGLTTVTGGWLPLTPRTLCVHGDSPHTLAVLEAVRREWPRGPRPKPGS